MALIKVKRRRRKLDGNDLKQYVQEHPDAILREKAERKEVKPS